MPFRDVGLGEALQPVGVVSGSSSMASEQQEALLGGAAVKLQFALFNKRILKPFFAFLEMALQHSQYAPPGDCLFKIDQCYVKACYSINLLFFDLVTRQAGAGNPRKAPHWREDNVDGRHFSHLLVENRTTRSEGTLLSVLLSLRRLQASGNAPLWLGLRSGDREATTSGQGIMSSWYCELSTHHARYCARLVQGLQQAGSEIIHQHSTQLH